MKNYWLLIETYVFIWKNERNILVYNTLNGRGYLYKNNKILSEIIDKLNNTDNLYCIMINEKLLYDEDISKFIFSLESNFCASLFDTSIFPQKPVVIFPEVNINEDIERDDNNDGMFGENILRNFTDLYIELTGSCELNCKNCNSIYSQVLWCHKSKNILPLNVLEEIFTKIKHLNIYELHLLGGNIFSYPFIENLISLLKKQKIKKTFYTNYLLFNEHNNDTIIKLKKIDVEFTILVSFENFVYEKYLSSLDTNNKYVFIIETPKEYDIASELINKSGLSAKVYPFYNGNNYSFFKQNVFLSEYDILNEKLTKNEIFANQKINSNYFGKLTISSDGYLYANRISSPVGLWNYDFRKVVHDELLMGESWRNIRSKQKTCNSCVYKDLCPPPSNYETAIGKPNLCHVHP